MNRGLATHDRFAARRAELERAAESRRLRLVVGLTALATISLGAIAFVNSSWFDVNSVQVVGNEQTEAAEIVEASGILLGDGLLSVDRPVSAQAVERLPWVDEATVRRGWNGQIEIEIVERVPAAVLPAGEKFVLIDASGRQLEILQSAPADYLPVNGVQASGCPASRLPKSSFPLCRCCRPLPAEVEVEMAGITVENGSIAIELASGGRATFGDGSQLAAKLQAFETVLARVDRSCLSELDVSVPEKPTVLRSGEVESGSGEQVPASGSSDC